MENVSYLYNMKEALYKKGDSITNHLKMTGKIFDVRWTDAGNSWIYFVDFKDGGQAVIKESNIKHKK